MSTARMWRIVEGEALILDPETGNYYSLNPVGTKILKGLTAGQTLEEIEVSVRGNCQDCPPELADEVKAFSHELRQENLDTLDPDCPEDDALEAYEYQSPMIRKYDQLHQVAAYSPDEI